MSSAPEITVPLSATLLNDHSFSRIDMYVEGLKDLSDMIMFLPLSLPG